MRKSVIKIVAIMTVGILGYYLASLYITLEEIKVHSIALQHLVERNYVQAVLMYMIVLTLCTSFTLPIMIPLTLVGGFLFGLIGAVYSTISVVIGSVISFMVFRHLFGRMLHKRYAVRLERFNRSMKAYGPSYLLLLHYSSVVPLLIINSLASLTTLSLSTFSIITVIGVLPVVTIYSFAGRELSSISSVSDIFSGTVIMAMALLMALAFVPILIKRFKGPLEV